MTRYELYRLFHRLFGNNNDLIIIASLIPKYRNPAESIYIFEKDRKYLLSLDK